MRAAICDDRAEDAQLVGRQQHLARPPARQPDGGADGAQRGQKQQRGKQRDPFQFPSPRRPSITRLHRPHGDGRLRPHPLCVSL